MGAMSNPKPYNNYTQYYSAEAPPQPAWSPPVPTAQGPLRAGWADPRASQQYAQQAHQNPTPDVFPYDPNQYGSMPGASGVNSQAPPYTWGVKYQQQAQQHQQHEPAPPLPPRPSSAANRIDTPVAAYQSQTSTQWQGRPSDISHAGVQTYTPGGSWNMYNSPHQSQLVETPPPPPPRPAAYAANWPHENYASRPPTHHYEPSTNPNWNQALADQYHVTSASPQQSHGYNNAGLQNQALVSPIDPVSNSWTQLGDNAATLSHTTMYDQYKPVQIPPRGEPNPRSDIPIQTATAFAGPTSDWEHFAPEPHVVSPEMTHSTPALLDPQMKMTEEVPERLADHSDTQETSDVQHEQNEPQSDGQASARQESFSSNVSGQSVQRTGTIDSVIHAWNAPLNSRKDSSRKASVSGSPSTHSARPSISHGQSPVPLQDFHAQTPTPQSLAGQASDPYSDLEPQARASLVRFVGMLRKESAAESDQEKFKIFDTFCQKERRVRAVLYDVDLTPTRSQLDVRGSLRQADNTPPALRTKWEATRPQSKAADTSDKPMPKLESNEKPELPKAAAMPTQPAFIKLEDSPKSKDDSFVMVDREQGDDGVSYSPGGRPLIQRPITVKTDIAGASMSVAKPMTFSSPYFLAQSPSDNAPQVVGEDYASTVPESPALAAPIVLTPKHPEASPQLGLAATSNGPLSTPVRFEPSRPVYTPFRYAEGHEAHAGNLDVQPHSDQDYLSKRNTYDASRLMHDARPSLPGVLNVASPVTIKKVQEETFLGLLRSHSTVRPKQKLMDFPESIRPSTTPPSLQRRPEPIEDAVRALREVLPTALPEKLQTDTAVQLRQKLEAFVDDFSFVRQTVILWDRGNREIRKKLDEERHKRQEESETRLDDLFNDKEIAYDELKAMEADFKLAEAERRYEEDKQELASFSKGVYEVVTERLQQQVDDLNKEYVLAFDLLDLESDSAARMLTNNGSRSAMSDAMDIVLQLFEKLNIRYHKLAEARFERERRRKRLELTVLYTNGDSEGTKRLEKEFSTAEKLQVLHEARDKDRRANQLMDSFERATVRGLGDNQAFLEDLFAKVRKLNDVLPANGSWRQSATDSVYGPNGARSALASAQAVVDYVLADSQALLTTSSAADKTLNEADYAVSVAEARAANADEATHSKLKADFLKEERKLVEEMSMRMDSITKTPLECVKLMQEIVGRVGDDGEHADRIKTALEQAKMRNAGRKET
jgi:hypothetical protein